MPQGHQFPSYIITIVIVVVLLAFRMRRATKARRLKPTTLWIGPALFVALVIWLVAKQPPVADEWAWLTGAALLGSALGWVRGRLMPITLAEDGQLHIRVPPVAMLFLLGLFLLRFTARTLLFSEAASWHMSPELLVDIFLVFVTGLYSVAQLENWLRARRVLAGL